MPDGAGGKGVGEDVGPTRNDRESNPGTEPFVPDFDTGEHPAPLMAEDPEFDAGEPSVPFVPDFDTGEHPAPLMAEDPQYDAGEPSVPFVPDFDADSQPFLPLGNLTEVPQKTGPEPADVAPAQPPEAHAPVPDAAPESTPGPVTVPGRYVYLKWWKLLLVLFGVWFIAGVFGLSLYYWWHHSIDRTPSVFVMFGYVLACTAGGLILAMVESKPLIAALAIAVMSAPFASVSAAAPLYGYFYCERATTTCLMGVIPS